MNRNSNSYTVIYATVMVVLVAVVLALAALGLKTKQDENSNNEKKQQILSAIQNVLPNTPTFDNAGEIWAELNMDDNMFVVNPDGQRVDGVSAFDIVPKTQFKKGIVIDGAQLPVFKATVDGKNYYILSMYGAGLWDAIWGYVAVEEDGNTIAGVTFDHVSETAGLGAKIKDDPTFAASFVGKHLFVDGDFKSVSVLKKGKIADGDQVDAITGATMTSNGVSDMIKNSISGYVSFLKTLSTPTESLFGAFMEAMTSDLMDEATCACDSCTCDSCTCTADACACPKVELENK